MKSTVGAGRWFSWQMCLLCKSDELSLHTWSHVKTWMPWCMSLLQALPKWIGRRRQGKLPQTGEPGNLNSDLMGIRGGLLLSFKASVVKICDFMVPGWRFKESYKRVLFSFLLQVSASGRTAFWLHNEFPVPDSSWHPTGAIRSLGDFKQKFRPIGWDHFRQ